MLSLQRLGNLAPSKTSSFPFHSFLSAPSFPPCLILGEQRTQLHLPCPLQSQPRAYFVSEFSALVEATGLYCCFLCTQSEPGPHTILFVPLSCLSGLSYIPDTVTTKTFKISTHDLSKRVCSIQPLHSALGTPGPCQGPAGLGEGHSRSLMLTF